MQQENRPGEAQQRFNWQRRLSRRELFVRAGQVSGAVALGGIASACASNSAPGNGSNAPTGKGVQIHEYVPGPQPVSGGRYGGTVAVGWEEAPNSFDPAAGYNLPAWDAVTEVLYFGSLLAYDKQAGGPAANICEMPTTSSDGLTLTFKIRPGWKFHNGRQIVASDIVYAWTRMLEPSLASWATSYLQSVEGWDKITAGKTKTLSGVEAPDDQTFVVHLTQPDFTILNACALPMTAPVPRESVQALGKAWNTTPVGFGPFKIDSYDATNQTATFSKFDGYYYKGLPYIDGITYHWNVDGQLLTLQLQHGDIDLVGDGLPPVSIAQFLSSSALKQYAKKEASPGSLYVTMYFNHPPFNDPRVRQALNWAVDREAIGRVTYGAYTPSGYPFPLTLPYTKTATPYGYDPQKAKQLLSAAGVTDLNATLYFASTDPDPTVAQVLQQQLGNVGVHLTLNQVSSNALYDLETKGTPDMSLDTWYMVQPTAADEVDALYVTGASNNFNHFSDSEVDRLAKQARRTFDPTVRHGLYEEIQKRLVVDAPYLWLCSTDWVAGVSPKIENYSYRGETYSYYDRLWFS